eukprot:COSAG03_NODE_1975_length_3273_cov_8.984877_5_plen_42_part_00
MLHGAGTASQFTNPSRSGTDAAEVLQLQTSALLAASTIRST